MASASHTSSAVVDGRGAGPSRIPAPSSRPSTSALPHEKRGDGDDDHSGSSLTTARSNLLVANPTWDLAAADDPSDWELNSFSHLRPLDASLRCELCFGIYVAPVTVKECLHTFCSACVRESINGADSTSGGQSCPKCRRKGVFDSHLVPNPAIEAACEAWRKARPELAKLQEEQRQRLESTRHAPQRGSTSSPLPAGSSSKRAPPTSSNGRASTSAASESTAGRVLRSAKRPRLQASAVGGATSESAYVVPDSDDDADDDDAAAAVAGRRRADEVGTREDPDYTEEASSNKARGGVGRRGDVGGSNATPSRRGDDYRSLSANDLVSCPTCEHSFTYLALQKHIDKGCSPGDPPPSERERGLVTPASSAVAAASASTTAANRSSSASGWFQRAGAGVTGSGGGQSAPPPTKLKRPQYELLRERDVVRLVSECKLRATGGRERCVARHRHWVNLVNANLDASESARRSERELRREMESWDRAQDEAERTRRRMTTAGAAAVGPATSAALGTTKSGGGATSTPTGANEWQRSHRAQFALLARAAAESHRRDKAAHAHPSSAPSPPAPSSTTSSSSPSAVAVEAPTDPAPPNGPSSERLGKPASPPAARSHEIGGGEANS